jgi:hypothetical protein
MQSDSKQQQPPKRSYLIPIVGWSWTAFGCLLIGIALMSLVIRVVQGRLPLPSEFHLTPLRNVLRTSGVLFTIGSAIAVASQLMIRRKVWAWQSLRIINLGFVVYILINSVLSGQFPTFSRLHQPGIPPAMTYFFVAFAIFVLIIWLGFFVVSLCLLSLKRVSAEFPSAKIPSA